jgi:membrane protease YdiL (CAAX protease family)
MDTAPIQTKFFLIAVFTLVAIETAAILITKTMAPFSMEHIGLLRMVESIVLILIIQCQKKGLNIIGLAYNQLQSGLKTGIIWSLTFAAIAALSFLVLFLFKIDPLDLIRVPLPQMPKDLTIFFLVGGIIAPISEEIFFRGIIFGYFSRLNTTSAVIFSTLIFVFFHPQGGLTQAVGGVVFALAYHYSHSLWAPILIHSLGNMALFSISLIGESHP